MNIPPGESAAQCNARLRAAADAHTAARARPQSDVEKLTGTNGPQMSCGPEFMRVQALVNKQTQLSSMLSSVGPIEKQVRDYPQSNAAWINYRNMRSRMELLASEIASLRGETVRLPARMERDESAAWLDIPPDPDRVVVRAINKGLPPGAVAPGIRDGIQTDFKRMP
jgi:hypothetical protein